MDRPASQGIPPELRAFLYSCIDSIEQVEILLLLQRTGRCWTARAVSVELVLPGPSARIHLETLAARGLLQVTIENEVAYRYAPRSAELRRYGDQLGEYYGHSPTQILRCIAATPRRALKHFADAFKLREPE
jgi:predicted ArsR family transcriptional regulator